MDLPSHALCKWLIASFLSGKRILLGRMEACMSLINRHGLYDTGLMS